MHRACRRRGGLRRLRHRVRRRLPAVRAPELAFSTAQLRLLRRRLWRDVVGRFSWGAAGSLRSVQPHGRLYGPGGWGHAPKQRRLFELRGGADNRLQLPADAPGARPVAAERGPVACARPPGRQAAPRRAAVTGGYWSGETVSKRPKTMRPALVCKTLVTAIWTFLLM